jgi:hypothetical protein
MPETTVNRGMEQLRAERGLRALNPVEDGLAAAQQPAGVYGFTYAPGEATIPFFSEQLAQL